MIPIPKPKFFERKVPTAKATGQSEDDYFDVIVARQTHILRDAIDRVSFLVKIIFYRRNKSEHVNYDFNLSHGRVRI